MSQNVSQVVENISKTLHDELNSNTQVANMVMALIGKLVIMATQQGKPIEGITMMTPVITGRTIRSKITFNSLSLIHSMGMWHGNDDVFKYALGRSAHMARALEKNPSITKFFTDFLLRVKSFAENKRIEFKDLKFDKAFISPANVMVVSIDKEGLSVWER